MKIPDVKELVDAARHAVWKMKREYDRIQPNAGKDECWSEALRLHEALMDFDQIYPSKNEEILESD